MKLKKYTVEVTCTAVVKVEVWALNAQEACQKVADTPSARLLPEATVSHRSYDVYHVNGVDGHSDLIYRMP